MKRSGETRGTNSAGFEDPKLLRDLQAQTRFAWLWLAIRVGLGWFWFDAGRRLLHEFTWLDGSNAAWVAQPAAIGLTLAGIALILGAFVGVAAFAGGLLWSGLGTPGPLSFDPVLFAAAVWLVIAWKTAGWVGLDRWLLPLLGMPWRGGALLDGQHLGNDGLTSDLRRKSWTG
jgi:thiosulfate dehydrogenase [quinone] large subunit